MPTPEMKLRQAMIDSCKKMNDTDLNQGTSGNISVRRGKKMLITPSAIAYDEMRPRMIASMPIDKDYGAWQGPKAPSTEWRFHLDIMRDRDDVGAIVHLHPPYATAVAINRKAIPACHYMIAAFGGNTIRCSGYARYGTKTLSRLALKALKDRHGCLLANHGMIALGTDLNQALWRAVELETIAKHYMLSLQIGKPVILSKKEIQKTMKGFETYGVQPQKPAY
ncbi:MAG: class II aldolase/adducin family protein [Pseudomonadota bacterium]